MKYILPTAFDLKVEKVTSYKSRNIRKDYDIIIKPIFNGGGKTFMFKLMFK